MIDIAPSSLAIIPGFNSIWSFFEKGGVFMIPLVITSIAALAAIVYKILSLTPNRVIPADLAKEVSQFDQHLAAGTEQPILRKFQEGSSALARLGAVAAKHRGRSHSRITTAIESSARAEILHLYAGIGLLDVVITIAPLLGLLGAASGLVVIFQGFGETTNHVVIARGIAEALTTTIFGLAIAVPAVIANGIFLRRIEVLTARLEALLADLAHAFQPHGDA